MKEPSIIKRFWQYQKERFSFFQNGLMITVFTFSAASYSIISRGGRGFIPPLHFLVGALTSFLFFFMLRVFDEFKDADDDARFRPYRPVPRGLITLGELGWIGLIAVLLQIIFNLLTMPMMLLPALIVLLYMGFMRVEFFISGWLRKHPIAYMLSHMLIMPLIDFYTTGLDWINRRHTPSDGLWFFLLVTFFNGMVIEIGRKIRSREAEETGVETYSSLWGARQAALVWLSIMTLTFVLANIAAFIAGFGLTALPFLILILLACSVPALMFLRRLDQSWAAKIELAAGMWTMGMYLILGAAPMIVNWFKGVSP